MSNYNLSNFPSSYEAGNRENSHNNYFGTFDRIKDNNQVHNNPFAYLNINPRQQSNIIKRLNQNPMTQSVDDDYLQLVESQIISKQNPNSINKIQSYVQRQQNKRLENQNQYQNQDLRLEDYALVNDQTIEDENSENHSRGLDNLSRDKVKQISLQSPNKQLNNQKYDESYKKLSPNQQIFKHQTLKNFMKNSEFEGIILNQQISEVKYRLDQLMKKFPITDQQKINDQSAFKKKDKPLQNNSQQKRSRSSDQKMVYEFKTKKKNNQDFHTGNRTQQKIQFNTSLQKRQINQQSQLIRTSPQKVRHSLDYSESVNNSKSKANQEILANIHIESLYNKIHQQEQTIHEYKQIIFKLQNQRSQLLEIVQNQIQEKQRTLQRQREQQIYMHSLKHQNSFKAQQFNPSQKDEFHRLQKQYTSDKHQEHNKSENLNINPNLEQKIQILEAEKIELLNKINWLNGVVEQMMNMGSRITKNDKQFHISQKSSNKDPNNHFRNPSGDSFTHGLQPTKQFKQLQTSFTWIPTSDQSTSNNYKMMYEKSIQNQLNLKNQIQQFQTLQNLYSQQFKSILKQIKEIKQSRGYYQNLKKQITRSQSKNKKQRIQISSNQRKKMAYLNKSRDIRPQVSLNLCEIKQKFRAENNQQKQLYSLNNEHKKIFQNQLIYQLKKQNQELRSKYLQLKVSMSKNNQVSRKTNNKQILLPSPREIEPISKDKQFKNKEKYDKRQDQQKYRDKYIQSTRKYSYQNKKLLRPVSHSSNVQEFNNIKSGKKQNLQFSQSQVYDFTKKSFVNVSDTHRIPAETYRHTKKGEIKGSSRLSGRSYDNMLDRLYPRKSSSRFLQDQKYQNLKHSNQNKSIWPQQKIDQEGERSSQFHQQQVKNNIVNRYNNFIRNLKNKFGINSNIVGKSILINDLGIE